MGSNVKVVIRARPLDSHEEARGVRPIMHVRDDERSLVVSSSSAKDGEIEREFFFHACLPPAATQREVMGKCGVRYLLDCALRGYHAALLAYGQTGSGKTYTITGKEEVVEASDRVGDELGLVPRSVRHLFQRKASRSMSIRISNFEIYNEQIYDLLGDARTPLKVRWDQQAGFYVQELTIVECETEDTANRIVAEGVRKRRVRSHEMNRDSSRSHSILTFHCETPDSDSGASRYGKISFVDLAGSERLKMTKSTGDGHKESANINRSLMCLGKVIALLGDPKGVGKEAHIPYRDSKLTKLLMDTLGGNSLTLMIGCCSVAPDQLEETLSTLYYAQQAKNIVNTPVARSNRFDSQAGQNQQDPTVAHLQQQVAELRRENLSLRSQLEHLGVKPQGDFKSRENTPMSAPTSSSSKGDNQVAKRGSMVEKLPPLAPPKSGGGKQSQRSNEGNQERRQQSGVRGNARQSEESMEELRAELLRLRNERAAYELNNRDLHQENSRLQAKLRSLESAFLGFAQE